MKSRTTNILLFALLIWISYAVGVTQAQEAENEQSAKEETIMPEQKHFFVRLLGTREGWPDDITPEEEKIMAEHYQYLVEQVRKGNCIAAGPVFDPVFGLIILKTESREAAEAIMAAEPSVKAGVHTYEMSEMVLSLLANDTPEFRYPAEQSDRILEKSAVVNCSLDDAWHAWTTTEGITSFLVSEAHIELRVGGPFEVYFLPDQPYGLKGSENCKILSYLPKQMLSFEWNAPPNFMKLRNVHTRVVLRFDEVEPGKTEIKLSHLGWGVDEQWNNLYDYFDKAWSSVLAAMQRRFEG